MSCLLYTSTGEIEIKNVTAEVSIKASGAEIFQVKEQTENIEIKTSEQTVKEGEPFKCELAPATGYKFPYVIKVMMNGRLLKQKNLLRAAGSEYYTYDNTTGIIEIENVDGEIVIEAKGVQEGFFEVIPNLVNLTSDPASFEPLAKDSKVELTLKAASGYTLPTSITVKMGENTLASTDYTYNSGTGAFALEKITATLVITAAGNRIPEPEPEPEPTPTTYMVTLPVVEGATLIAESSTNVESGKSFAFTQMCIRDSYCTFAYLSCGMPFADMARLTTANLYGEEIVYRRKKTGILIRVGITAGMRRLINKYADASSPYLFPILSPGREVGHEEYKAILRSYNNSLKKIGRALSRPIHLTSYVFRHTWATNALRKQVPLSIISQALGHTSEKTTRFYLASLEQSELNRANARVTEEVDLLLAAG